MKEFEELSQKVLIKCSVGVILAMRRCNDMLLYFKVRNYRSFRDEAVLDMEAAKLSDHTDCD